MKEIKLTQGKVTQVDDWNYEWLNQWEWQAEKSRNTYYAVRHDSLCHNKQIAMHRLILNTPINLKTDHEDHNGLNNQEYNIRNCTTRQNNYNRSSRGKSKYLGVTPRRNCFVSQIRIEGSQIYLGYLKTEEHAAKRYDAAAQFFHGEFANLNFKI